MFAGADEPEFGHATSTVATVSGRLPEFVIIGAIRAGTTSLARYLGAHPQVFMAEQKEVRFFNSNLDRGLEWYMMQFRNALPQQIVGEATPAYMSNPAAMASMAKTLPDTRLIAVLREPANRAWSHYWMRRERGREQRTFADAVGQEMRILASEGPDSTDLNYLNNSMYAHHIRRAVGLFPEEAVRVVIFEQLLANPTDEYAAICRFLQVSPDFLPESLGTPINSYVAFRSLGLRRVSRRLPRPLRRPLDRINTRKDVSYPKLDDESRKRLSAFFAAPNRDLEELLGRQVPEWST